MAKATYSLAIEDIWNSVALEERLELISKSQASGILAAVTSMFVVGSIGYGLDNIWFLLVAGATGFFIFPLFSSQTWRTGKPSMILAYLAVRTVARRYAHGFDLPNIDIVLIYRGSFEEIFENPEEHELQIQSTPLNLEEVQDKKDREAWIILMRGGIIVLSEKRGGAKMEFVTPILSDTIIESSGEGKNAEHIVHGAGVNKGRKVIIRSNYPGAHYVFLKRTEALIYEAVKSEENLQRLRQKSSI